MHDMCCKVSWGKLYHGDDLIFARLHSIVLAAHLPASRQSIISVSHALIHTATHKRHQNLHEIAHDSSLDFKIWC